MANEKRLIYANVVLAKQFTAGLSDASGNYYGHADVVFVDDIENAPTVDAVEVVHGRWGEVTDQDEIVGEMDFYKCSVCGKLRWFETNYCPNCGADMRGSEDE